MAKEGRPYIGVVIEIDNCKYFAPMTSASNSRGKLNSKTTVKIFNNKNIFLGAIRLNNMIPCKETDIEKINFSLITDIKYKNLLNEQYQIINYELKDRIKSKAEEVYTIKINNSKHFISQLCCDFKELENTVL